MFFRFLFFFYFFGGGIFGTETNTLYAILTSRWHNLYEIHNSKSAVQWFVFTVATNMGHAAVSQINVAEHGGLFKLFFLTSSLTKVREIFVFWVLYAFSTLGDDRQLVE